MTNSSPQEPQNPIPERRTKAAAGVTFDEMIAIIVAFATIGAILFWSLGGRKGGFANNFGLGGQSTSLTGKNVGLGIGNINANSDLGFGEIESDRNSFRQEDNELIDGTSIHDSRNFEVASRIDREPNKFDTGSGLASLGLGAAAIPSLANRSGVDRGFGAGIYDREYNDSTPQAVAPEEVETPEETPPQAAAPEEAETPEETPPQAAAPEEAETPEETPPQAAAPEEVEIPDDIVPSYWAYPFVKQMSDRALVADFTEDQDFEPDKLITRAGMATLISQAFDNEPKNEQIKKFKDVSNKNAIAADVDEAVKMGFMQGYSADEFRPLENIPRYQVLVTLATGLGLKPSQDADTILQKFGDSSDMPDWAKQQVAAAAEAGLIVNRPNVASNSLNPNVSATRAEVAAMIHQALVQTGKLEPIESEYILKP